MKRLLVAAIAALTTLFSTYDVHAQMIGIGTDAPAASLDINTTTAISSINIDRLLGNNASAANLSALLINDRSADASALEILQLSPNNIYTMIWAQNAGLWTGLNIQNTNASGNGPTAVFIQEGGIGLTPSPAVYMEAEGSGDGLEIYMDNTTNVEDGLQITHLGTGWSIYTISDFMTQEAMLNWVYGLGGIRNVHFNNGGDSYHTNMEGLTGTGFYFDNYDAGGTPDGGDGFGADINISTQNTAIAGVIQGAAFGSNQWGIGPGVFMDHYGDQGRGLEVKTRGNSNEDATIYAVNLGDNLTVATSVIVGAYTGADTNPSHTGVYGESIQPRNPTDRGYGVFGVGGYIGVAGEQAGNGLAGIYSVGDVAAFGTKAFIIDHPEDPANKMLKHFAMESNEVLNVYRGMVRLNASGRKRVELPDYFHAINSNYTYQLTPVGSRVQPFIDREIRNGSFIVGGEPGTKVSWTVYASRDDAYVRNHPERIANVVEKDGDHKGKYLDPESHGQPRTMGIFYRPLVQDDEVFSKEDRPKDLEAEARQAGKRDNTRVKDLLDQERETRPQGLKPSGTGEMRMEIKTWDEIF